MDTRTRSSSPAGAEQPRPTSPPVQDKISAYYSLVFPHFTFYIQTLSITIGRRCAPNAATSSTADQSQVDVDLGALKSVSRLHAKIEYDQEEDRFVLAVIGRNGAWVDGVWSGAGTRAPLSERSQIQIASRTFHFILPPPPPPEDTPSPSSQSSANRQRSPSVDITSISPPSSQPSHSPPPINTKLSPPPPEPKPKGKTPPQPQLPNSNTIGKSKAGSKKRKKGDADPLPVPERPKPEDMPPKPPFTYAQLIYRAIKDIGGKATLQEICTWIMNTHDYYRFTDGAWMSSVRHNLSSGRAFLKMERCGGDRGKGFFWSIDEKHAQALEEQESKFQQAAAAAAQGITSTPVAPTKSRKRDKGALLEPPLKRSVKGDLNCTLPPPLTSVPLSYRGVSTSTALSTAPVSSSSDPPVPAVPASGTPAATGVFPYPSHPHHTTTASQPSPAGPTGTPLNTVNPYAALAQTNWGLHPSINSSTATASTSTTPTTSLPVPSTSMASAIHVASTAASTPGHTPVPDVVIPIVLGPIPLSHPDYTPNHPNNSAKEGYMVLHERKLILDPDVFASLTKEMLVELEKMGARAALAVLTNHMVRALKERRARGRGKERGGRRPRGAGGRARKAGQTQFTNVSSDHTKNMTGAAPDKSTEVDRVVADSMEMKPPTSVQRSIPDPVPITGQVTHSIGDGKSSQAEPGSPLIVVDDSENEEPPTKKRKVEGGLTIAMH